MPLVRRLRLPKVIERRRRDAMTLLACVVLVPVVLATLGAGSRDALHALWEGSIGSFYALTSGTLVRATPLILTGLSVGIAFRGGVLSIGAEGQLLVGAALAASLGAGVSKLGVAAPAVELIAGVVGGAAWAGIAALLRAKFHVLEVISTILLNFIALYLVGYLVRGPLQEPLHIYPQSSALVESARLPRLLSSGRLHAGVPIAVACALAAWWFVRGTAAGFRLRAVGANPDAARSAGEIDVARTTIGVFLISGALAGLAGAVELSGVTFALYENISPGYGYSGIAVALLARLDPRAIIGSGIAFGALEAGASAMQRDAGVPAAAVSVVEAVMIIALVMLSRAPDDSATGDVAEPRRSDTLVDDVR